jgi:peptide/nickel transport system substrate-binding protein
MYTPLDKLPQSVRKLYEYNPNEAKKLLAEAGYPNGFKTEILCTSAHESILSVIKAYWANIGVDLRFDVKEDSIWRSYYVTKQHKEMYYLYGGWASPYRFLDTYVRASKNVSMVDDPRVNEAKRFVDSNFFNVPLIDKTIQELVPYILEQCWVIEPPHPYLYTIWPPWVKNYHGEFSPGLYNAYNFVPSIWLDTRS